MSKKIRSVLIVDDNEADRFITRRVLEKSERFEDIYAVNDGEEVIDLFANYNEAEKRPEHFPPLIMLLDINMPRLDGFETLARLAELNVSTLLSVVVMLTSSSQEIDQAKCAQYSFVKDYITKPLSVKRAIALADMYDRWAD